MTNSTKIITLFLRLGLGWIFLYSGFTKTLTFFTPAKDFSAAAFLNASTSPFASLFTYMSGNIVVDYLNAYGQLLIGLALVLGFLIRWTVFWAIILMVLYYLAGYPPKSSFLVDQHIIYIFLLLFLAITGAGKTWGLDFFLKEINLFKKNTLLRNLL